MEHIDYGARHMDKWKCYEDYWRGRCKFEEWIVRVGSCVIIWFGFEDGWHEVGRHDDGGNVHGGHEVGGHEDGGHVYGELAKDGLA